MTNLPEISAELATYFSLAAATLGPAVVASAAQRIADESIATGQGYFRRLFRRSSGSDAPITLPEGRSEQRADELLGALSLADRQRLAEALRTWLHEQQGRLNETRLAELITPAPTYHMTTYGSHSPNINLKGDNTTFNFGGE